MHVTIQAIAAVVAAVAAVAGVLITIWAIDDPGGDDEPQPVGASVEELARATVRIDARDADGDFITGGSGSVITSDGLVLTAAHLVDGEPARIEIGIAERAELPTEFKYRAEVATIDQSLDLAVLKITGDIDGNPEAGLVLPFVETGDSDTLHILDDLRILGYPGTGGETLTATRGQVSGFAEDSNIGERSIIKTDATISGGSSGGMAVDHAGRLIGVPIQFGSGDARASLTECRQEVADTNGDGLIDEADSCVPLGGFINSLRPVNFARALIAAAKSGEEYVPLHPESTPAPGGDVPEPAFENLRFGPEATEEDQPTQVFQAVPAGATSLCGFWDYAGMTDGTRWDAVWYVNGHRSDDVSYERQVWGFGESGTNWVCVTADPPGLSEGVYELAVTFDGIVGAVDAIFVGGEHPPATLTVRNNSGGPICDVFVSPSGALHGWGGDDLPADLEIEPQRGESIDVTAGTWDVLLEDCNGVELDTVFGIEIADDYVLEYPVAEEATPTPAAGVD
jgi:putative serine protease PepD